MKISHRQLRRVIREALITEGYSVPNFPNTASMEDWVDELVDSDPEAEVDYDVMDPETGEVLIPAGESASEQQWYVAPEPDGPSPEELAAAEEEAEWDWDAYEREKEEKLEAQHALDKKMQEKIMADATAGGKDWAADTLYQARQSPKMWQDKNSYQQWDSPEDYVLGFGQDAAGDMGQSLEYSLQSNEEFDWYQSLPTREPDYYSASRGRPTKQIMKDVYADYFYDGVSQAVKQAKAA